MNNNNIAVILARQHSKGIPLKNLREVGGVSLVGRAILAAQQSGIFDEIIVSTDGVKITAEAQKFGASVMMRPDELANDTAKSIDGVIHVLNTRQIVSGSVVLLQPTSPLRTGEHIKQAFDLFIKQGKMGAVISGCLNAEHHPYKTLLKNPETGEFYPAHDWVDLESPRQILPPSYRPNGAIYVNNVADLLRERRFFVAPLTLYEMSVADSLDIDNEQDLIQANSQINPK